VSLEGNDIVIKSGILSFGLMCSLAPFVEELPDCGIFYQPIYNFASKFIEPLCGEILISNTPGLDY
jgi:hypothetical protein